ncbi:MAG: mechanosensitive ion channel [bacterium]|nr:mechanosensitive ion channel [bacterium]
MIFFNKYFLRYKKHNLILLNIFFLFFLAVYSIASELNVNKQTSIKTGKKSAIMNTSKVILTPVNIKDKINTINKNVELPSVSKQKIINFYNDALKSLQRQQTAIKEARDFGHLIKDDISHKPANTKKLNAVRPMLIEQKARSMALVEIEGTIAEYQSDLAEEQTKLELNGQLQSQMLSKPIELKKKIAAYENELTKLEYQLKNTSQSKNQPRLVTAKKTSIKAKSAELNAELKVAELKIKHLGNKREEISSKLAIISRKVIRLNKLIKTWQKVKDNHQTDIGFSELRRNKIILSTIKKNSHEYPNVDFLLNLAKKNKKMAENIIEDSQLVSDSEKELLVLDSRYILLEKDFSSTKRRIKMMGLTRKSGQILQAKRVLLNHTKADPLIAKGRNNDIINVSLKSDDILQEEQDFLRYRDQIYNKLDELENKSSENQFDALTIHAYILLESYRKLLSESGNIASEYLSDLNKQQIIQKKIDLLAIEYNKYINQRLLWTSSSPFFSTESIARVSKVISWFKDKTNWNYIRTDFISAVTQKPLLWIFIFIFFIISICLQFILPKQINKINKFHSQPKKDSIRRTTTLLILVLVQASCISLSVYYAASNLQLIKSAHILTVALCTGIVAVAEIAIIFYLVIILCRTDGIGIKNFRWSKTICKHVRRFLISLFIFAMPFIFIIVTIQNSIQNLYFRSSLGRILFVMLCLVLMIFFIIGIKKLSKFKNKIGFLKWLSKYHYYLKIIIILITVFIIGIALSGYYFTAYEFSKNLGSTLFLLIIISLATEMSSRFMFLGQIHIAQAREKQKKEMQKSASVIPSDGRIQDKEIAACTEDIPSASDIDNVELSEQASKLSRLIILIIFFAGLIMIWSDFFPSIRFLDNIIVWTTKSSITAKDGATVMKNVTMLNVLESLLTFICTVVIVRNLKPLLETVVFRGKKYHIGTKHAFELISQYILTGIGFFLVLKFIGIGWAQFQYLAAAMTLGISFGLKDIFANFISGIIILVERPIRLGDSVTVAGSSGVVTKIRIRSTTITDFDRQELIIPNQAFLTEKIVNWSLSDRLIRMVIEIGIGYSSDAGKAEKILLQIAKDNSMVLDTPPPSVLFTGFGASSLDFNLRVFVNISDKVPAQHKIRHEINNRFKEEGIEIPFSQHDLHINHEEGPLKIEVVGKDKI